MKITYWSIAQSSAYFKNKTFVIAQFLRNDVDFSLVKPAFITFLKLLVYTKETITANHPI